MPCCTVYCTAATREEAVRLGQRVVEERLAACANVLDGAISVYWWEGQVQQSPEAVLLLKTRRSLRDRLIDRLKQLHAYDCPCVVSWDIAGGNADYLRWIESETLPDP